MRIRARIPFRQLLWDTVKLNHRNMGCVRSEYRGNRSSPRNQLQKVVILEHTSALSPCLRNVLCFKGKGAKCEVHISFDGARSKIHSLFFEETEQINIPKWNIFCSYSGVILPITWINVNVILSPETPTRDWFCNLFIFCLYIQIILCHDGF